MPFKIALNKNRVNLDSVRVATLSNESTYEEPDYMLDAENFVEPPLTEELPEQTINNPSEFVKEFAKRNFPELSKEAEVTPPIPVVTEPEEPETIYQRAKLLGYTKVKLISLVREYERSLGHKLKDFKFPESLAEKTPTEIVNMILDIRSVLNTTNTNEMWKQGAYGVLKLTEIVTTNTELQIQGLSEDIMLDPQATDHIIEASLLNPDLTQISPMNRLLLITAQKALARHNFNTKQKTIQAPPPTEDKPPSEEILQELENNQLCLP